MFPNPYNFTPQTYPLGYHPWAHAQAQFRVAQAQLQQAQAAAYNNVQPTLIQQAQTAALQQQQQAVALQAALQRGNNPLLTAQHSYNPRVNKTIQHPPYYHHRNKRHHDNNHKMSHKSNNDPNHLYPKTCTICNVVCNSALQWNMHIKGKKHCKQIRGVQYQNSIASTTNLTSTSTTHNLSLDHHNVKPSEMIPSDQYVVEIDGRRKCALCNVEFTSAMCEMSHIKGKRHKMAMRGHPQHYLSKKRKAATVSLGRCDLCDVDFTSGTQKDSHLTGKKHSKNVRLVDAGQPPKKRQKTNYFSSFQKSISQKQSFVSNGAYLNGMEGNSERRAIGTDINVANNATLKPHERLQLEVETIYREYTQIAKSSHPLKAQQVYQKYQETYDQYIREYNLFADNFKNDQKVEDEEGEKNEEEDDDLDVNKEINVMIPKEEEEDQDDDLQHAPTITTISTVKEEHDENEGNDEQTNDDDDC